jgi:hypothetical protein
VDIDTEKLGPVFAQDLAFVLFRDFRIAKARLKFRFDLHVPEQFDYGLWVPKKRGFRTPKEAVGSDIPQQPTHVVIELPWSNHRKVHGTRQNQNDVGEAGREINALLEIGESEMVDGEGKIWEVERRLLDV